MKRFWLSLLLLCAAWTARAQDPDYSKVEIKVIPVGPGVSMLEGAGGNIGVSSGPDGVFIIDDQFAPLLPKIRAAIRTLSDKPIRFLVNTHWHRDHTGGNTLLGESGVLIFAHDNVRKRLSTEQVTRQKEKIPPSPPAALPVVTFADGVTFHFNGDDIEVRHVARAHTDGDSIIRFRKANAVHMGDTFFNGMYPFIDVDSGGSIDGMIAAADKVLGFADDQTRIVMGHGRLGSKADLRKYREMLVGIRDRVKSLIASGKTLEQVTAAKPTAQWDGTWGKGYFNGEVFTSFVYRSLTESKGSQDPK
jgi:cyclase